MPQSVSCISRSGPSITLARIKMYVPGVHEDLEDIDAMAQVTKTISNQLNVVHKNRTGHIGAVDLEIGIESCIESQHGNATERITFWKTSAGEYGIASVVGNAKTTLKLRESLMPRKGAISRKAHELKEQQDGHPW